MDISSWQNGIVFLLTLVVVTPQSSVGGSGVGARGVSMNSKSSEASEAGFDMSKRFRTLHGRAPRVSTNMRVGECLEEHENLKHELSTITGRRTLETQAQFCCGPSCGKYIATYRIELE